MAAFSQWHQKPQLCQKYQPFSRKCSSFHNFYPREGSCREIAEVSAHELKKVLFEMTETKSAERGQNCSSFSTTPLSSAFALLSSYSL